MADAYTRPYWYTVRVRPRPQSCPLWLADMARDIAQMQAQLDAQAAKRNPPPPPSPPTPPKPDISIWTRISDPLQGRSAREVWRGWKRSAREWYISTEIGGARETKKIMREIERVDQRWRRKQAAKKRREQVNAARHAEAARRRERGERSRS